MKKAKLGVKSSPIGKVVTVFFIVDGTQAQGFGNQLYDEASDMAKFGFSSGPAASIPGLEENVEKGINLLKKQMQKLSPQIMNIGRAQTCEGEDVKIQFGGQ